MSVDTVANIFIIGFPLIGLAFALYQFSIIAAVRLEGNEFESDNEATNLTKHSKEEMSKVVEIYTRISEGADSFLFPIIDTRLAVIALCCLCRFLC